MLLRFKYLINVTEKYIGQNKRQFGTRLKEHQKAVFFCEERKFSFVAARMPNQPYNRVG